MTFKTGCQAAEFGTTHQTAPASRPEQISGLRDANREKRAVTVEVGHEGIAHEKTAISFLCRLGIAACV